MATTEGGRPGLLGMIKKPAGDCVGRRVADGTGSAAGLTSAKLGEVQGQARSPGTPLSPTPGLPFLSRVRMKLLTPRERAVQLPPGPQLTSGKVWAGPLHSPAMEQEILGHLSVLGTDLSGETVLEERERHLGCGEEVWALVASKDGRSGDPAGGVCGEGGEVVIRTGASGRDAFHLTLESSRPKRRLGEGRGGAVLIPKTVQLALSGASSLACAQCRSRKASPCFSPRCGGGSSGAAESPNPREEETRRAPAAPCHLLTFYPSLQVLGGQGPQLS